MMTEPDFHTLKAMLEWHVEMGVDEAIGDAPVDRYAAKAATVAKPALGPAQSITATPPSERTAPRAVASVPSSDRLAEAVASSQVLAAGAADLGALRAAMGGYEYCDLKRGARNLVFADGTPGARVMIVGEAPGRDEDRMGRPFVGAAGQLLDRMLAAIGLDRSSDDPAKAVYITNVLPWRPPENRNPTPDEIAMMRPFLARHIELANPQVVIVAGNISCTALLGKPGILRMRGTWTTVQDRPALPMVHPAYLLRTPSEKRTAWHDLLMLQAKLREL